jgi:hypothetical protein
MDFWEEQLEKVRVGLKGNRQQFLPEWFKTKDAYVVGQDPTNRGNFAREADLTSEEGRLWGNTVPKGKW